MAERDSGVRVYGAPDPDNRQPAPDQGMRGEQGASLAPREDLSHELPGEHGPIAVQEQSGVSFAEATGRAAMPQGQGEAPEGRTRDAGPENIRDNDGRGWDKVDEKSDESFPASDPPASGRAD